MNGRRAGTLVYLNKPLFKIGRYWSAGFTLYIVPKQHLQATRTLFGSQKLKAISEIFNILWCQIFHFPIYKSMLNCPEDYNIFF